MSEEVEQDIKEYIRILKEEQDLIEKKEKMLESTEQLSKEEPSAIQTMESPNEKETHNLEESAMQDTEEVIAQEDIVILKPTKDIAQDLFEKTEQVLRKYSLAYISQNIENSQLMLLLLEKTASILPFNTDFEIRGNIEHNISSFRELIDSVQENYKKQNEKTLLEGFLTELDKNLRRYTRPQIEKDPERAQYDYNVLIEKKKSLPKGNPTYEMVVTKRLEEFENRILSVIKVHKAKEEHELLEKRIGEFLKHSKSKDFEILYHEYRAIVETYNSIKDNLEKSTLTSLKNNLYLCKEKMDKLKNESKRAIRKQYDTEEKKKKDEYFGIRTFWKEYLNDLRLFTENVNTASPPQYFLLYEKYSSLLNTFYSLVRNDMISKEESQQATQILEYVEHKLDTLRINI
ncbi:MAG: hypothetical protein ACXQS3_00480 [Candidatus Methanofastidiosia archaeon]